MKTISWLNLGAVVAALALAWGLVGISTLGPRARPAEEPSPLWLQPETLLDPGRWVRLANGERGLTDASGHVAKIRDFRRIVSASTVADQLLLELCEPDRIVAFSAHGAQQALWGYRYAGKALIESSGDLEAILALAPDLVLVNNFGDSRIIARLREAGVEVFDLGEMRGVAMFVAQAAEVADLLGHPERALHLVQGFTRRLQAVAAGVGAMSHKRGLYLVVMGTVLYGGTVGTSYNDVLTYAGLLDAAAESFRGWPQYTSEDVLTLDPEIIVTKTGMGRLVCRYPGLERLRACRGEGKIIELPEGVIDDAGLAMLDATEALYTHVYGRVPLPTASR